MSEQELVERCDRMRADRPVPACLALVVMGVHVIGTDYTIGGNYPASLGSGEVTAASPTVIDHWRARPLS